MVLVRRSGSSYQEFWVLTGAVVLVRRSVSFEKKCFLPGVVVLTRRSGSSCQEYWFLPGVVVLARRSVSC